VAEGQLPVINFQGAAPNMSGPPTGSDMDLVASHIRLLAAAALRTQGDVLELGCGWYSTPLLHEITRVQGRRLWTFDNQPYWLPPFEPFKSDMHLISRVGWWQEMYDCFPKSLRFGLVFVDQGQPIEREYAIRELLKREMADVFVMHDTEEGHAYGYTRTLPLFKYKWTDESQKVHTTVASNTVNVRAWGLIPLQPHDPSEQIT
jgi:hypothetical protein